MKLFGSYRSPFVRQVAITMNVFGMRFDHLHIPISENPDAVNEFNPLTRVPTLVLDDGEVLIESCVMVDALTIWSEQRKHCFRKSVLSFVT